jgi:hypothetical protein
MRLSARARCRSRPRQLRAECGVPDDPLASGRRLHRGGNRQANSALWRITLVCMGCHQPTKDYIARRIAEGKTKTEIMRCLPRSGEAQLPRSCQPELLDSGQVRRAVTVMPARS